MQTQLFRVDPRLRYPKSYIIRIHPAKQIEVFKRLLPKLDYREVEKTLIYVIPELAEDYFIVPHPEVFAPSLAEATEFMLIQLGINPAKVQVPLDRLRVSERTKNAAKFFRNGDFLAFPAQLGFSNRGRSVEEARKAYAENEFGLDLYLAAACLVSHSGRLTGGEDELGIDCPGNEDFNDLGPSKTPCFNSFSGGRRLMFNRVFEPNARYGSATGFIPR